MEGSEDLVDCICTGFCDEAVHVPCIFTKCSHKTCKLYADDYYSKNGCYVCHLCNASTLNYSDVIPNNELIAHLKAIVKCSGKHEQGKPQADFFCPGDLQALCSACQNGHRACQLFELTRDDANLVRAIGSLFAEFPNWPPSVTDRCSNLSALAPERYALLQEMQSLHPEFIPESHFGRYYKENSQFNGIRGAHIPQCPYPGYKALARFFAVFPGIRTDFPRLDSRMQPIAIFPSTNRTEALTFRITKSIVLCAFTIGNSLSSEPFTVSAELMEGETTAGTLKLYNREEIQYLGSTDVAVDVWLTQEIVLLADTPYTLIVRVRPGNHAEKQLFYHGNFLTAPEIVMNEEVLVDFFNPRLRPGEISTDSARGGLILRLLYKDAEI